MSWARSYIKETPGDRCGGAEGVPLLEGGEQPVQVAAGRVLRGRGGGGRGGQAAGGGGGRGAGVGLLPALHAPQPSHPHHPAQPRHSKL